MKPSYEKAHLDTALDEAPDSFLFDLNWSAQKLTDAMCRSLDSLDRFALALPSNDAEMYRPHRRTSYIAIPPLPARFRIGG